MNRRFPASAPAAALFWAFALVLPAGFLPAHAQNPASPDKLAERDVQIEARAFDSFAIFEPSRREFGRLTFLGGLELRARDPEFGGFSSAVIDADGKGFLALSDHAHWIRGRFIEENGVLKGVEQVRLGALRAPDGRRAKDTRWFDSEGMARFGPHFYVSVERAHDILRFDAQDGRPVGRPTLVPVPPAIKQLRANNGIEALGVMPRQSAHAGALIAIAERSPIKGTQNDIPGFLIGGRSPGTFHIRRSNDFDITDLAFLPSGDLLILERRFTPFIGLAFRIRRIALSTVKPGAILDGEVLIEADLSAQIDNMEALMVHRGADGRVILTVMSDDNFSILQRNLVLRFAMDE